MTTPITPEMLRVGAEARIRELETKFAEKESEARSLARELKDRVAELEAALDRYTRLSESGESLGGELDEREKRMELEAKLAAAIKHATHLLTFAEYSTTDKPIVFRLYDPACPDCVKAKSWLAAIDKATTNASETGS